MVKNKKRILCIAGILLLLAVIASVGILMTGEKKAPLSIEKNAVDWPESSEQKTKDASGQIAVPGMETMTFKADQKKQEVNLYNPDKNDCYFRISILLEDGTLLAQTGLLAPGKGVVDMELSKALPEGAYENAVLRYECLSQDEALTLLHSAKIRCTIESVL